jgi:hypothetical protein
MAKYRSIRANCSTTPLTANSQARLRPSPGHWYLHNSDIRNSLSPGRVEPQRGEGIFGKYRSIWADCSSEPLPANSQARWRPSPGRVKKVV